jgi:hypothetical protein
MCLVDSECVQRQCSSVLSFYTHESIAIIMCLFFNVVFALALLLLLLHAG